MSFYMQRQQFAVAQEMFKESPSLTREQKALILGFMAGSRGQLLKQPYKQKYMLFMLEFLIVEFVSLIV